MMKATIFFQVGVEVEVPDELPEAIRQLARDEGENYVRVDASDREIMERIAVIRGLRGYPHDESMTDELNVKVRVRVEIDEDPVEFQWAK